MKSNVDPFFPGEVPPIILDTKPPWRNLHVWKAKENFVNIFK